jgi:hypothetical protein
VNFIIYLSESGCPGFQDLQDCYCLIDGLILCLFLSESGCPGFQDLQDVIDQFSVCIIASEFKDMISLFNLYLSSFSKQKLHPAHPIILVILILTKRYKIKPEI